MYRKFKIKAKRRGLPNVMRLLCMLLFITVLAFSFLIGSVPNLDTELSAAAQTAEQTENIEEELDSDDDTTLYNEEEEVDTYSLLSEDYITPSKPSATTSDNAVVTPYKSPQIFTPSVTLDEKEGMVFKDDVLYGLTNGGYSMLNGSSGGATIDKDHLPTDQQRLAWNPTIKTYFKILVDSGAVHWSIDDWSFANCSKVTSFKLQHNCGVYGYGYIGQYAFYNATALNEFFMFMDGRFHVVRQHAFDGCENLYEVTLENAREGYSGTTDIGDYAFRNCKSLKGFLGVWEPKKHKHYVNGSEVEVAKGHCTIEHVPSSLSNVGRGAFQGCEALENWFVQELLDTLRSHGNRTIPAEVFEGCTSLTSVTIPYGYTTIDAEAFKGCTNLTTVYLPSTITSIGAGAFKDCTNLQHIYYSGTSSNFITESNTNLTYIGGSTNAEVGGAFENCVKLIFDNGGASLSIPRNVTTIGENAFKNVSSSVATPLSTITMNAALTSLGNGAFSELLNVTTLNYNCTNLSNLGTKNLIFNNLGYSKGGVTLNIASGVTRIPNCLFYSTDSYGSQPKLKTVNFVGTSQCSTIGQYAFAYASPSLTSISMPASLKTYEDYAFYRSRNLKTINFGSNVQTIGQSAFESCTGLSSISLSNTCQTIKKRAFYGCNFSTANLGTGLVTIGESAFEECNELLKVTTGDNCTTVSKRAFFSCDKLKEATLGAKVETLGESAFENCVALEKAIIGPKCVTINNRAFFNCKSLVNVNAASTLLQHLGDQAFEKCSSLPEINIAHTLTYLGTRAFADCKALKSIHYCEDSAYTGVLETINKEAFLNCESLESIYIPVSLTRSCYDAFKGCKGLLTTTYYGTQEMWTSRIIFENGYANPLSGSNSAESKFCVNGLKISLNTYDSGSTTKINDYVFFGYAGLSSILITPTVTEVGKAAFAYCTDLQSTSGFTGLTAFSESMFEGCSKLYSISIPANIKSLGRNCFKNCTGLGTLAIPDTVTEMLDGVLFGCVNMKDVRIPFVGRTAASHDSYEGVLGYIFGYYTDGQTPENDVNGNPVSATHQYTDGSGKKYYYYLPETLKKVTITQGNVNGGKYWVPTSGFQNTNMTAVELPNRISKLGDKAFMGCKYLTDVTITLELNEIGAYTFSDCSALEQFLIPDAVTIINEGAFRNCVSLIETNLHENITSLGHYAFEGCTTLSTVTLFENVALLGRGVFKNCTGLTVINFNATECKTNVSTEVSAEAAKESPFYNAGKIDDSGAYLCKLEIGVNALGIYAYTFSYLNAGEVTFYNHSNCGLIGDFAFYHCVMHEVTNIPSQLKTIDSYAFAECTQLTTFEFPGSVTTISAYAFYHCPLLTEVTIPEPVTTIKEFAFAECASLQRINFNAANVTSSSSNIFFHSGGGANGDGSIIFIVGNAVTQIPANLFYVNDTERDKGNASKLKSVHFVSGGVCKTIGAYAFANCVDLETVEMSDTVTSFGAYAFYYCQKLSYVLIPSGTQIIQNNVFAYSGLTSAQVPEGVATIHDYAFYKCEKLRTLSLPDSLVTLSGSHMFQFCSSLQSIRIPELVTRIQYDPSPKSNNGVTAYYGLLFGCNSLESLTIPFVGQYSSSVIEFDSVLGYIFGYSTIEDNNVLQTFVRNDGSLGSNYYYIPNALKEVTVTLGNRNKSINSYAFNNCKAIQRVTLGSGIISIGSYAFLGCSGLETINIPASVVSFGDNSFKDCRSPETTSTRPGIKVVYGGSLTQWLAITFNNEYAAPMREHGQLWIGGEKVSNLNIPDEIKEIKAFAFLGCDFQSTLGALGNITIPITVQKINRQAFYGCTGIGKVNYNASECNETAGDLRVFTGSGNKDNNTKIVVGPNVLFVPQYLFRGIRAEEVQFSSQTCTYIGEYAFADNPYLVKFEFPASITNVKAFAFDQDTSETDVYYTGNVVQWTHINFNDSVGTDEKKGAEANPLCYGGNLYTGAMLTGASAGTILKVLDTDASITRIEAYTFAGCTSLEVVHLNSGVVYIGDQAFYGCRNLHDVYIADTVTEICERVFGNCPSLATLAVNDANKVYTSKTKDGKTQLNSVVEIETKRLIIGCKNSTIPDDGTVKIIGEYAFEFITTLTTMNIANAVETIESSAFYGCTGLKDLTLGEGIKDIQNFAFYNCTGVENLKFNCIDCNDFKANNYIFYRVGREASKLDVVFGQKVQNVPAYVFYPVVTTETMYAPGVTKVSFESGCECKSIGEYAFIRCDVLTEVTLPEHIEEIGVHAFDTCSKLTAITLPDTLLEIKEYTFYNCKALSEVHTANTIKRFNAHAFEGCESLTSAGFYLLESADVEFIGLDAFRDTKIVTNWLNGVVDSGTSGGSTSLNSKVLIFKNKYIILAKQDITELVMDDKVTLVASQVFSGRTSLTSVTYSKNLRYINSNAFYNCTNLVSGDLSGTDLVEVGDYAFYNCQSLASVKFPDKGSMKAIGDYAFLFCINPEFTNISIPSSVVKLGLGSLAIRNLQSVTLPFVGGSVDAEEASESTLFGYIFGKVSNNACTEIVQNYSADKSVTYYIPTNLKTVVIIDPDTSAAQEGTWSVSSFAGAENFYYGAFGNYTWLTNLTLPQTKLKNIHESAFYNCSSIESLVVPNSVETIENYAFYGTTSLTDLSLPFVGYSDDATAEKAVLGYIFGYNTELDIDVPMTAQYYAPSTLGYYYIPESLTKVTVTRGRGDSSIYYGSFSYCTNLTSIVYDFESISAQSAGGVTLTTIDPFAFYYCTSLESVTIPYGVTRIGTYAFYNTTSLNTLDYNAAQVSDAEGETFSSSSNEVFYRAGEESESGIKVTFGKDVQSIPANLFNPQVGAEGTAPKITSVTFEEGSVLTSIGSSAFRACNDFGVLVLPNTVRAIGDQAFYGCSALQWMYLPSLRTYETETSSFAQLFSVTPYSLDTTAKFDKLTLGSNVFADCNPQMILIAENVTEYTNYNNVYHGMTSEKVNFNKAFGDTVVANQYPLSYTVTATFWVLEYDSVFKEWVEQHTQDKRLYNQNVNLQQNEDFSWSLKGLPVVVEYYRVNSWRNTLLSDENAYDILSSTTSTKVLTNKPLYRVADIAAEFTAKGISAIDDYTLANYKFESGEYAGEHVYFEDGDQVYYYAHEFEIIFTEVSKPANKDNYTYNGEDRHSEFLDQIYSNTVDASGNVVEGKTWSELLQLQGKPEAEQYTLNSEIFTISRIDYTAMDGVTKLHKEFAYTDENKDAELQAFLNSDKGNLTNAGTYELTLSIVKKYWRIKYRWQDNVVNNGQNTYKVTAVINPAKTQFGNYDLSKEKTFDGTTHIDIAYSASALSPIYAKDLTYVRYDAVSNFDTAIAGTNKRIYVDYTLIKAPENATDPIYGGGSFIGDYLWDAGETDLRKIYFYNYYLSSSPTSRFMITDQIILTGGTINKRPVTVKWTTKDVDPDSIWTQQSDWISTPYTGEAKMPYGVVQDTIAGYPVSVASISFVHEVQKYDEEGNPSVKEMEPIDPCIKVDNTYEGTITLSDEVNYEISAHVKMEIEKAELNFKPVLTLKNEGAVEVGVASLVAGENTVLTREESNEENKPKYRNILYTSSTLNKNALLSFPATDELGVAMLKYDEFGVATTNDMFIGGTFTWTDGENNLLAASDDNKRTYSWKFELADEYKSEFKQSTLEGTISIAVDNVDIERLGYLENEATYPETIYAIYTANMISNYISVYGYNNDGTDAFGEALNNKCTFELETDEANKQQFVVGDNKVIITYSFTDKNNEAKQLKLPITFDAKPFAIAKPADEEATYDGNAHGYVVKDVAINTNIAAKDVSNERPIVVNADKIDELMNTDSYQVSSANAFTTVRVDDSGNVKMDEEGNLIGYEVKLKIKDEINATDSNGNYYYQWDGLENSAREITVFFVIKPQVVEISGVTSVPKVYDGTTSIWDGTYDENGNQNTVVRVSTNSLSGVVGNDDLKFDFDLSFSKYDSPDVGARTIETTVVLSGDSKTNYILANSDGVYVVQGTIIPKPVELEWVTQDGSGTPFTFTYNGREQAPKANVKHSELCTNYGGESPTTDECAVTVDTVMVHAGTYTSSLTLSNANYTFKSMSDYGSNYTVTAGANGVNPATVKYTIGKLTLTSSPKVIINRYGNKEDLSGNKLYSNMSTLRQVTLRMPDECYIDGEPILEGSYHFYSSMDEKLVAGIDKEYGCYFSLDSVQSQEDCVGYTDNDLLKVKLTVYTAVDEPLPQSFTFDGNYHNYFIEETARYGFSLGAGGSGNQFIDANAEGYDVMLKMREAYSAAYAWGPDLNVDENGRLTVKFYGFPASLPAFTPVVTFVDTGNPDEIYTSNTLEANAELTLPDSIFENTIFQSYIANKQLYDPAYTLSTYDICDMLWIEGQTLSTTVRSYNYTVVFKNEWAQNFAAWSSYNAVDVTVTEVAPDHLVAINNNASLIYTSNGLDGLKEWLTVYLFYNDGSRRNTALSSNEYKLSLSNGGTLVSGTDSQYQNDVIVSYVADATVESATVKVYVQYTILKTPVREQTVVYDGQPHVFIISSTDYADNQSTVLACDAYALSDEYGNYYSASSLPYVVNANETNKFYLRVLAGYAWDTSVDPTGSGILEVNLKIEKADLGFAAKTKLIGTPHLYANISNLNSNVKLLVPDSHSYIKGEFEWLSDPAITSVEYGITYSWRFTLDPACQGNFNQVSFNGENELKAYYPIATPADQTIKYTGSDLYYDTDKTGKTEVVVNGITLEFGNEYIFERADLDLKYKNVGIYEFRIRIKDDKFAWDADADEFSVAGSDVGVVPVKFTIVPAVLTFDITINEKEYDGLTSTGSALTYTYTAAYGDRTETGMTTATLTDLAHIVIKGTYQDSYLGANDAKNVGSTKLVIVDLEIADDTYGNYALYNDKSQFYFSNCVIVPRTVTLSWSKIDLDEDGKVGLVPAEILQIGEENVVQLTYNGEEQKPYATVTNLAGSDICYVLVSTETPCIVVNPTGEHYTASLSLTNTNYKLADSDKTVKFDITKRLLEFDPIIKFIDEKNTEFKRLYVGNPLSYVKLEVPEFGGFKGEFAWKSGDGFDLPDTDPLNNFTFKKFGAQAIYWTFTLDPSVADNFCLSETSGSETPTVLSESGETETETEPVAPAPTTLTWSNNNEITVYIAIKLPKNNTVQFNRESHEYALVDGDVPNFYYTMPVKVNADDVDYPAAPSLVYELKPFFTADTAPEGTDPANIHEHINIGDYAHDVRFLANGTLSDAEATMALYYAWAPYDDDGVVTVEKTEVNEEDGTTVTYAEVKLHITKIKLDMAQYVKYSITTSEGILFYTSDLYTDTELHLDLTTYAANNAAGLTEEEKEAINTSEEEKANPGSGTEGEETEPTPALLSEGGGTVLPSLTYEAYCVLNTGTIAWKEGQTLVYDEFATLDTYSESEYEWIFTPSAEYADTYDVVTGKITLKVYVKEISSLKVDFVDGAMTEEVTKSVTDDNGITTIVTETMLSVYSNNTLGDVKSYIKVQAYLAGGAYAGILNDAAYTLSSTKYPDETTKLSAKNTDDERIVVSYTKMTKDENGELKPSTKIETHFWLKVLRTPLETPEDQTYTYEYGTSYKFEIEDPAHAGYSVVSPQTYTQSGTYEIHLQVADINEFYWVDDPTKEDPNMYVDLVIEKKTLDIADYVKEKISGQNTASPETLYESSNLYNHTSVILDLPNLADLSSVYNDEELAVLSNGSIVWDAEQALALGTNDYAWTFTPSSAYYSNYTIVTGTLPLTVISLEVVDFAVVKYSTDPIYETYLASDLKDWINVYEVYNSGEYGNLVVYPDYSLAGVYPYDANLLTVGSNIITVTITKDYPTVPTTEPSRFVKTFVVNVLADLGPDNKFAILVPETQVKTYNGMPQSFELTSSHYQIISANSFVNANEEGYDITLKLFTGYYWATLDADGNYVQVTPQTPTITVKLIIERITLTLTDGSVVADPKVYDGNTTVTNLHYVQSGLTVLNPSDYSVFASEYVVYSATATYADPNVGTDKDVNLNVTLSGANAANYKIDENCLTIKGNITPKILSTVNWSNTSLVFTGFERMPTGTIPQADLIGSDVCGVKLLKGGVYAGEYTVTAADMELDNANYKLADSVSVTFTIEKVSLSSITPTVSIVNTQVGILFANDNYNLSNVKLSLSATAYNFKGLFHWVEYEWELDEHKFSLDFAEGDPHPGKNTFHWRFEPLLPSNSLLDSTLAMTAEEAELYWNSFNIVKLTEPVVEEDSAGVQTVTTTERNYVAYFAGEISGTQHIDYSDVEVTIWQGLDSLTDVTNNVYNGTRQYFDDRFMELEAGGGEEEGGEEDDENALKFELVSSIAGNRAWQVNAGEYTIYLCVTSAATAQYYTWSEDDWSNGRVNNSGVAYVKFTISKAKLALSGITGGNKVYDGSTEGTSQLNASGVQYTVKTLEGDIQGLYSNHEADDNNPTQDTVTFTVKGKYNSKNVVDAKFINLTFTVTSDNYVLDAASCQKYVGDCFITARPITVSWGNKSFTYTSFPQKPEAEAQNLVEGDTCKVSVKTEGDAINVNDVPYVAYAYEIDNSNYELTGVLTTEFFITKATPKFDPIITIIGTKGSQLYTTSNIYTNADLSVPALVELKNTDVKINVPGKLEWAAGQILIAGTRIYQWKFTPDDTSNFESVVSISYLTVLPIIVTEMTVSVTSSRVIYTNVTVDEVRNYITVMLYNNDGNLAGATTDYTLHNAPDDNTLVKGINTLTCVYTLNPSITCDFDVTVYDRSAFSPITVPKNQSVVYDGKEHSFELVEGLEGEGIHYTILSDNVYVTANEDGYSVRLKADEGYYWYNYDKEVEEVIVKFIIYRAEYEFDPMITIKGSNPDAPYTLYTSSSLYDNVEIVAEGGTIVWSPNQVFIAGLHPYYYTFTPDDTVNYKITKASRELAVEKVELKSLAVEVKSNEDIYTTNSVGDLKDWLNVYAVYSDGSFAEVKDYTLLAGASTSSTKGYKLVEGVNAILVSYNTVSTETELNVKPVSNNLLLYLLIGGGVLLLLIIVAVVLFILYRMSFKYKVEHSENEVRVNCREIENAFVENSIVESKMKWPNEQFCIGEDKIAYLMFKDKQLCLAMNIPEDLAMQYADVIEITPYKNVNTVTALNSVATVDVLKGVIQKVIKEELYVIATTPLETPPQDEEV